MVRGGGGAVCWAAWDSGYLKRCGEKGDHPPLLLRTTRCRKPDSVARLVCVGFSVLCALSAGFG